MPIALTLMRTSFGPGAGTWTSTNSRTSGPPAFANLIERDMAVSAKTDGVEEFDVRRTCRMFLPPTGQRRGRFQGRQMDAWMPRFTAPARQPISRPTPLVFRL